MRHRWIITLLVCLFLLGEGAVVIFLPQVVHYNRSSEVYKKYCQTDGVDATFIKDYQVNDTLTLSVTILKANDSTGWALLKNDFSVGELTPEDKEDVQRGKNVITFKMIPQCGTSAGTADAYPDNVLVLTHRDKTMTVFHINSDAERHAVFLYHIAIIKKE